MFHWALEESRHSTKENLQQHMLLYPVDMFVPKKQLGKIHPAWAKCSSPQFVALQTSDWLMFSLKYMQITGSTEYFGSLFQTSCEQGRFGLWRGFFVWS